MVIYKTIEPINVAGREPYNELKIEVKYTKEGYNSKRGVYAWINPISRSNGIVSMILLGDIRESGFKVCLKEMARKSQKVEDAICAAVEPLCDKIAEHYNKCEFQEIIALLKTATYSI